MHPLSTLWSFHGVEKVCIGNKWSNVTGQHDLGTKEFYFKSHELDFVDVANLWLKCVSKRKPAKKGLYWLARKYIK